MQHIYYLVDESGSMMPRRNNVINGLNEFLKSQENKLNTILSIYTFSHEINCCYEKKKYNEIGLFNENKYLPVGSTALYDSIGYILNKIKNENDISSFILIILTDGEENSSFTYHSNDLLNLIQEIKTNKQLDIVYVGSNQESIFNQTIADHNSILDYDDNLLDEAMRSTTTAVNRFQNKLTPKIEFTKLERDVSKTVS